MVSVIRYRPISKPARSGLRRLIRLGISTFTSAIAQAARTVPGNSSTRARKTAPEPGRQQNQRQPDHPLLAEPASEDRSEAGEHREAQHGHGGQRRLAAVESPSAWSARGKTGGRPVIAPRMLNETARMPTISSAPPAASPAVRAWRPVAPLGAHRLVSHPRAASAARTA